MATVIAPNARLGAKSLVSDISGLLVVDAAFLAVDKGREPEIVPRVNAPAIKIEIVADQR